MAPPRGLSTPRALKAKIMKKKKKRKVFAHEIIDFLTDLYHNLHAQSCTHFLWFPHTPRPPRALKRPQHFNLFFALFFQLLLFGPLFRAHLGYGYTSRAGAIILYILRHA